MIIYSSVLVDGIATVADRVGKELAPHVKKHGSKLIPESLKKNKDGQSNVDGALLVASSGIQGSPKYYIFFFHFFLPD